MGFQEAFIALAEDKDLTGETYKVFMYMLGHLGFENYIAIPQVQIAKDLSMHKEHVSRAIKVLVTKRIIVEGPKLGRTKTYRLNSQYGWRGTVRNLEEARNNVVTFPDPTP
jgi:DNA-binding MarR family transcriptional regulator